MLSELKIQGYRKLKDVSVTLGPLNVFIGANGCGKTSILDALDLIPNAASGNLQSHLAGRFPVFLSRGAAESMRFEIKSKDGADSYNYYFTLDFFENQPNYVLGYESFLYGINDAYIKTFKFDKKGIITSQDGNDNFGARIADSQPLREVCLFSGDTSTGYLSWFKKEVKEFKKTLNNKYYRASDLHCDTNASIRSPQVIKPAFLPSPDGSDLYSVLYGMREGENAYMFEELIDTLSVAFPTFEYLKFPPANNGNGGVISLNWKEKLFPRGFNEAELSEGTLRFLFLLTVLYSRPLPPALLIDEPEVSLHPQMLELLVAVMREASAHTQIFVATHSQELVRLLKPEEVVVCDVDEDDGFTRLNRLNSAELKHWLDDDFSLSQLWNMNVIGGR